MTAPDGWDDATADLLGLVAAARSDDHLALDLLARFADHGAVLASAVKVLASLAADLGLCDGCGAGRARRRGSSAWPRSFGVSRAAVSWPGSVGTCDRIRVGRPAGPAARAAGGPAGDLQLPGAHAAGRVAECDPAWRGGRGDLLRGQYRRHGPDSGGHLPA